jgi:outer membrane protein
LRPAIFFFLLAWSGEGVARELTFREALRDGFDSSREIKESEELVRSAKSVLSAQSSSFYPTVNLLMSAGTYHDRQPVPGDPTFHTVPRDRNQYDARIQGSQVLFSGFSSFADSARAKAILRQREEDKRLLEFKTVSEIVDAYFGIQNLQRQLASESEILKVRKARMDQVLSRVRAGRATDLEEIQARLAIQSQEPSINSLKNQIEAKSLQLNRILGKELTDTYRLIDELTPTSYTVDALPPISLAQAYERALQYSPEIKKVEARYEEVIAELKVAEASQMPKVSLNFQAGSLTPVQREIGSQESIQYGANIDLNIPLFSGFSSVHAVSSGKSKIEAALERRALVREQLFQNLQQTYRAWEVLKKNIESGDLSVKTAKRGTERSEALYSAGRATLLDVLDSYTKRLEEERKLSDALFDRIRTIVQFRNLIGERL